jgi:hypothetical protein
VGGNRGRIAARRGDEKNNIQPLKGIIILSFLKYKKVICQNIIMIKSY